MKQKSSRAEIQMGVIMNYSSLIMFLVIFNIVSHRSWSFLVVSGAIALLTTALTVMVFSFIRVHIRSGLWKLSHSKVERLDEREIQVTHEALRYSYGIFTVICLAIIYFNSIAERGHIHILIAASLLYLAHTLPASIIALKGRDIIQHK